MVYLGTCLAAIYPCMKPRAYPHSSASEVSIRLNDTKGVFDRGKATVSVPAPASSEMVTSGTLGRQNPSYFFSERMNVELSSVGASETKMRWTALLLLGAFNRIRMRDFCSNEMERGSWRRRSTSDRTNPSNGALADLVFVVSRRSVSGGGCDDLVVILVWRFDKSSCRTCKV